MSPDQDPLARIDAPRGFSTGLAALLEPGTTILVTDAPVLEHTTGPRLDVIATGPALVEDVSASTPPMPRSRPHRPVRRPASVASVESVHQLNVSGLHRALMR